MKYLFLTIIFIISSTTIFIIYNKINYYETKISKISPLNKDQLKKKIPLMSDKTFDTTQTLYQQISTLKNTIIILNKHIEDQQ